MKAMILAAGLGTRMRPLTLDTPKPLLPINDVPMIEYHIRGLVAAGITDIVINHAWLGEQIEALLGDGTRFGANLCFSAEQEPLETAGGIRKALPLLTSGNETQFLVVNGDVYTDYPFEKLLGLSSKKNHLVLVANPDHNLKGDFCLDAGLVKPERGERYTFSGISVLSADLFADLVPDTPAPLAPLLRAAIERGDVSGELYSGCWIDIGTPERLKQVDQMVREQQKNDL